MSIVQQYTARSRRTELFFFASCSKTRVVPNIFVKSCKKYFQVAIFFILLTKKCLVSDLICTTKQHIIMNDDMNKKMAKFSNFAEKVKEREEELNDLRIHIEGIQEKISYLKSKEKEILLQTQHQREKHNKVL